MEKKETQKNVPKKGKSGKRKKYLFGRFARWVLSLIFPRKYNIIYSRDENLKGVVPPYFLFGNHTSALDPFLMGIGNDCHVNYVTNDEYFRYRSLSSLMRFLGAVPKTKFMTGAESVRQIFRLKDDGAVIGLYPEGGRTWQGLTQPLLFSTSKLVKKLQIPVVCALTRGGSLSFPRWARYSRKGKISIHYSLLLTAGQVKELAAEEIHEKLTAALAHDEVKWNRLMRVEFKGKKLAETLEWFLYACPHCGKLETMRSCKNMFTCTNCGFTVRYNGYGLFEGSGETPLQYDNVADWSVYQRELISKKIAALTDGEALLKRKNVSLFNGISRERALGRVMNGTLRFTREGFTLSDKIETKVFSFDRVRGLTINYKNVIDFYIDDDKLRLEFDEKEASGYIWEDAMKALQALFSAHGV